MALSSVAAIGRTVRAQLLGPEIQVGSDPSGFRERSQIAADRSGLFMVVWQSGLQYTPSKPLSGRRYDSSDQPLGAEFQISGSQTTGADMFPFVDADGSGRYIVTWKRPSQGILARQFDTDGLPLGNEFLVNEPSVGFARQPVALSVGEGGDFVVAWRSSLVSWPGISTEVRRFSSAGVAAGGEFTIRFGSIFGGSGGPDSLAVSRPGEFVVGYERCDGGYPGGYYNCNPMAGRWGSGPPVSIEVDPLDDDQVGTAPRLASKEDGGFVATWESFDYSTAAQTLRARRIDGTNTPLGESFQVNTGSGIGFFSDPRVAVDRKGNFLVVWQTLDQDGSGMGVSAQRFAADGSRIGGEFQVNDHATGDQVRPGVAAGRTGDFVVVWQGPSPEAGGASVFARRVRSSIFWGGFELGDPCGWSSVVGASCL